MTDPLPLGLCGWSLDRHDAARAIEICGRDLQLPLIQIGLFGSEAVSRCDTQSLRAHFDGFGVSPCGVFVAFDNEDYSSIASIAATGGLATDEFPVRRELVRRAAGIAAELGAGSVAIHVGTIPRYKTSDAFARLADHTRGVAMTVEAAGSRLLLETGREPAETLLAFFDAVGPVSFGVNFDPANFIIYGTDEPASAAAKLRGRIDLVHLKDAARSPQPGVAFGKPAPFGAGDVQIARVVSKLRAGGYQGPLLLEIDARDGNLQPLQCAIEDLRKMLH